MQMGLNSFSTGVQVRVANRLSNPYRDGDIPNGSKNSAFVFSKRMAHQCSPCDDDSPVLTMYSAGFHAVFGRSAESLMAKPAKYFDVKPSIESKCVSCIPSMTVVFLRSQQ